MEKICKYLDLQYGTITFIFCDNEYIKELNREYRKKDKSTDIITFAYQDAPFPEIGLKDIPLGDIFISLEKALDQSEEYENGFKNEIQRLLIHGVLHIIGFDHEKSREDEIKMMIREEELLKLF